MSYSTEVLADSPLAYWRLGESSGSTIVDSSGNSRDGTYAGSYTLGASGLLGGDSDTAVSTTAGIGSIAAASWMNVGSALSIECWFSTTTSGTLGLVGRTNAGAFGSANTNTARIYLNSGQLIFQVFTSVWQPAFTLQTTSAYSDGLRHHVVGTWDGSTATLYVDGQVAASTAASFTIASSATLPFYIGKMAGFFAYNGTTDEVAYYSTCLSAARVTAHFDAGGSINQNARIEANYLEVMYNNPVMQTESVYAEVLAAGSPLVQTETVYAEVLAGGSPLVRAELVYAEVLVSNALLPFRGWGVPI
ncbi:MAG: LamG domain-containing protein [Candidatus Saccharimonadales bacterium]